MTGSGVVRPVLGRHGDDFVEYEGSQSCTDQLHDDVARDSSPLEVPTQGEGDAHGGIQMGTGYFSHEQDDSADHEPWGDDGGRTSDHAGDRLTHHAAPGGHHHQEESPQ